MHVFLGAGIVLFTSLQEPRASVREVLQEPVGEVLRAKPVTSESPARAYRCKNLAVTEVLQETVTEVLQEPS
jgi:hypothetical protein